MDKGKWRLLFQASRDGFAAEAFHSKCDNKGLTVTIVKSGEYIFGGFTEVSWTSKIIVVFSGILLKLGTGNRERVYNSNPCKNLK